MHITQPRQFSVMIAIVPLLIVSLLVGCGSNTGSGDASPPATTPSSTSLTSPVSLQIAAASYQAGSTISVTINNQSPQTISFTDHQTNCTVLLLERQAGGSWQIVAPCQLRSLTRMYTLDAGKSQAVSITSSSQWSTGTYRARLDYSSGPTMDAGTLKRVYSSEFRVG